MVKVTTPVFIELMIWSIFFLASVCPEKGLRGRCGNKVERIWLSRGKRGFGSLGDKKRGFGSLGDKKKEDLALLEGREDLALKEELTSFCPLFLSFSDSFPTPTTYVFPIHLFCISNCLILCLTVH